MKFQMPLPFSDSWLDVRMRVRRPSVEWLPRRPAAGVLLRYTDVEGDWYLLGRRCDALGGTWANLGGSLDPGEHPLAGALREFSEETELPVRRLEGGVIDTVLEGGVADAPYTLFVINVFDYIDDANLTWENTDLAWHHASTVDDLDLHRLFRAEWDVLNRKEARRGS